MKTKTVYQTDSAGHYVPPHDPANPTVADESPLEEGVWIIPGGCVEKAPPPREKWPPGKWPRWIGRRWDYVNEPKSVVQDPMEKLRAFLIANPDVAKLVA